MSNLPSLPPDDPIMLAAVKTLLSEQNQGKSHWLPTPKQQLLVDTPASETLYGGSKGGGKTRAIAEIARRDHKRSLILRRTFPQLQGSLIDGTKKWFHNQDYYNVGD